MSSATLLDSAIQGSTGRSLVYCSMALDTSSSRSIVRASHRSNRRRIVSFASASSVRRRATSSAVGGAGGAADAAASELPGPPSDDAAAGPTAVVGPLPPTPPAVDEPTPSLPAPNLLEDPTLLGPAVDAVVVDEATALLAPHLLPPADADEEEAAVVDVDADDAALPNFDRALLLLLPVD